MPPSLQGLREGAAHAGAGRGAGAGAGGCRGGADAGGAAQRRVGGGARRRPGGGGAAGAGRAQRGRPDAGRRRDHGLRVPDRGAVAERGPQRLAGRRAARGGAGDHHRPAVRLLPAGGPVRRPGDHGRRLPAGGGRRGRAHDPGADGLDHGRPGRALRADHARPLPGPPRPPGHLGRADHREVGPGPLRAGRLRPPLPPAGRRRPGRRPLRPAARPGRGTRAGRRPRPGCGRTRGCGGTPPWRSWPG